MNYAAEAWSELGLPMQLQEYSGQMKWTLQQKPGQNWVCQGNYKNTLPNEMNYAEKVVKI